MKKPTVMCDIDGVLCDFVQGFTREARRIDPSQQIITTQEQQSWNLEGIMSKELNHKTWEVVRKETDWWFLLPMIADTAGALQDMHMDFHVIYCTSRNMGVDIYGDTVKWLKWLCPDPCVMLCKNKGELARIIGAKYAIDDRPENAACIHWLTDGACKSYIMDRPFNQGASLPARVRRVSTLAEFREDIRNGR